MEQQIITGKTRLVGIIGNPVSHSLSPIIHNHAFRKLELPYAYVPLATKEKDLSIVIQSLKALNFAGANITIPYKNAILPFCDSVSQISKLTGTVNTLYYKDNKLCGTTTDAIGFFKALTTIPHNIENGHVVILGNGGTARTLGFAFAQEKKIHTLTIIGRNQKKVDELCSEISGKTGFSIQSALFNSKECSISLKQSSLLINCTSVGMFPNIDNSPLSEIFFHREMTVVDVIYNPSQTRFLTYAQNKGCKILNGLPMLLYQGLASFKYWTKVDAYEKLFDWKELQSLV